MKIGDWVICPQTKDEIDKPNIVAQIDSIDIENNIVNIRLINGTVGISIYQCRVVTVISDKLL